MAIVELGRPDRLEAVRWNHGALGNAINRNDFASVAHTLNQTLSVYFKFNGALTVYFAFAQTPEMGRDPLGAKELIKYKQKSDQDAPLLRSHLGNIRSNSDGAKSYPDDLVRSQAFGSSLLKPNSCLRNSP